MHPSSSTSPMTQAARRDPAAWRLARVPYGCDLAAAQAFCRDVATRHYENFTVATRLVPPRLRQHLANVYAFARWSDDLADEAANADAAARDLADWRRQLDGCFAGRAEHPVFVALADTARCTGLTIEPFADLIDAFAEDAAFDRAGTLVRYATRADLLAYCRRSADPVGRIVLALEGCRDATLVAMSDAICTGLQLVNFWQDIVRDLRAGRVYLPGDDMRRQGVTADDLALHRAPERVAALVRDEVAWARDRFDSGAPLADVAPPVLRPAIAMFVAGGRALADAIERAGFDTLARRPTVGRITKLALAARAWWALRTTPGGAA
ncbi:MAG: squalene synthase HpnC [Planctomycetaceae bacterium]